jgi:hypothetical protein
VIETALILSCIAIGVVGADWLFGEQRLRRRKPKGPFVDPENSPCPACGNLKCELKWDPARKLVARGCVTCGLVITQPPVYPHLFEK